MLSHLIVRRLSGWWKCVSIQEKCQQANVTEDGCVEEPGTTHSSSLQRCTLLQQQAKKHTHTHRVIVTALKFSTQGKYILCIQE